MEREKFELYYQLLVEWNNKFNLTSVTERDKVELLHFKDSVLPVELIPSKAIMLDIGSGAGFPAIPLKIVRPDLDITMVDSVNKKVSFLSEVICQLKLDGIRAVHKRIEELDKNQKYDVVTSRAVAGLNILCEYCLPFVKKGGFMLAYKSSEIEDELSQAKTAIELLGGGEVKTVTMELNEEIKRTFVIIKKIKDTPKGYPRGGNKPRLKPIV
ncbi:MAG: 16S rRNA (guanine(527)-N(7))-methyltransferase RsmG [Clostridiales bacterium]|nr:16S rRNA (guanine(527)-N(7))-methyltransferase RsmG [Clostridiales bacterium]